VYYFVGGILFIISMSMSLMMRYDVPGPRPFTLAGLLHSQVFRYLLSLNSLSPLAQQIDSASGQHFLEIWIQTRLVRHILDQPTVLWKRVDRVEVNIKYHNIKKLSIERKKNKISKFT